MSKKLLIVAGLAALVAGVVMFGTSASAQIKKGKTRTAETKYLMRGIMQPNCAGLGGLLKGDGPADDKAWDTAACHASCLNEMSHLVMDDGRCPDAVWAEAAKTTLREQSAAVLAACEKKDLTAANAAFKNLTQACAACHKAHKGQ
jgi:cytochrome c556